MNNEGTNEFSRLIDDCINAGIIVFEKLEARLHIIAVAGQTLKKYIEAIKQSGNNPIEYNYKALKLDELDNKLDILAEKMSVHFNELEAFLIDHHVYTDVVQTASTLMKFMKDTISNPCSQSLEIFRDVVRKAPPLQYGYKVISLLEQDSTNPLKVSMTADKLKTSATFNKWKKIIDGVLSQFLFLETYLNGMFWQSDMYGPDQLKNKIKNLHRKMDKWSDDYSESYWPETVRQLVHETQDNYDNVDNELKANILEQALTKILTSDVFYILVYDECDGNNHSFSYRDSQTITSFRRGSCNVVIYRSRKWMHAGNNALNQITREVESCRYNTIPKRSSYEGFPDELCRKQFTNVGFVGIVRKNQNVTVSSANSFGDRPLGPGWWITADVMNSQEKFVLIAGYE
uniref:Uncharacterized protein n=1 Tax=Caenorhabditis japonica TaxID=281687 RepID=A0A8R1I9I0_CAEJA